MEQGAFGRIDIDRLYSVALYRIISDSTGVSTVSFMHERGEMLLNCRHPKSPRSTQHRLPAVTSCVVATTGEVTS
jgi:hypothetical protein